MSFAAMEKFERYQVLLRTQTITITRLEAIR